MTTSRMSAITLAAFLTLAAGQTANAQIGGLIKKKVGEAVKGPDKKAEEKKADAAKNSPFNDAVLEITPPVLEGFIRGLKAEVALQKEFRAELAKYPTAEQYADCQAKAAMSDEVQKILAKMSQVPEKATPEQSMEHMKKVGDEAGAVVKRKCPLDPNDWNDSNKRQRLEQIRAKAAESAGAEAPSPPEQTTSASSGPFDAYETLSGPFIAPLPAAGLTPLQYNIVLERIQRFCEELKNAAFRNAAGSGGVKIEGTGKEIFWVYSATEAKTLSQANCQRVYDEVSQFM